MMKWTPSLVTTPAGAGVACKSMRGSICWSVFIVAAGAPGGVREEEQ